MAYSAEMFLDAVFLDIETTGIDPRYSELTLIALYQEDVEKWGWLYVSDLNGAAETLRHLERKAASLGYDSLTVRPLEQFAEQAPFLSRVATYNGIQFDLPFIAHHLPAVRPAIGKWEHLDIYVHVAMPLRDWRILRTPNLKLKTLLGYLQVPRHPSVSGLRGEDAIRLWNQWKHLYDSEALTHLALYALEDVRSTRVLLERLIAVINGEDFHGSA